jgi:hypothetical protein
MRRVHGKDSAFAAASEPCPVFALDEERGRMGLGQDVCLRVKPMRPTRRVEISRD